MAKPAFRREELHGLRSRLASMLSQADDALLLRMLWALNALQTDRAGEASRYLGAYPPDAATAGIIGNNAIRPWELETLANELLATPKDPDYRRFDYRGWNAITALVNLLRAIENAEYGARPDELSIFVEMGRIGARQFPWQRGYFNVPALYRSAFIYGQGHCADYLRESGGLTASDMILAGYCLLSVFYSEPAIRPASDLKLIHELGISLEKLERALSRISRPLAEIRREAVILRNIDNPIAYKPSILRRYPCLLVGLRGWTMLAPLPDLIMDRVTNGLFYDVVNGGGVVRDEIGERFEAYGVALIGDMLPDRRILPETTYRTRLGSVATPDILMLDDKGGVDLAIECKASRMSVAARFGEMPEQERGYEEIAKGVMQIWRFFAHCRVKVAPHVLAPEPLGMILTLDEWFAGRSTVIPGIIERANVLADASPHPISAADRRPVAFCTISELEAALATATAASLLDSIRTGSGKQQGWIFTSIHEESKAEKTPPKPYPFNEALPTLLPWFGRLDQLEEEP